MIEDCNLQSPNPYRAKAQGRQILSVPISCYCDDTSGNVSKKWNKHNSILFTLSGLAPEYIHLLYNIHFLATSNTAPPLEMFEAVVKQIQCVFSLKALNTRWILTSTHICFQGNSASWGCGSVRL